jgi:O-antigen/teichoic acid export membrane protein
MPGKRISRLRINIAANFFGKGWTVIMGLAFTPLYVKVLGVESYGLIGIYVTAQALVSVLDFGMGTALGRDLARYHEEPEKAGYLRGLARTLEVLYWCVALAIVLAGAVLSHWLADHWIGSSGLTSDAMATTLALMAWSLAFQWPFSLYSAGMNGLQRQFLLNKIVTGWATFRWGGAAAVLLFVSPTIHAFFVWQIVAGLLQSTTTAWIFWRQLPATNSPAGFQPALLRGVGRFASGVAGAAILGMVLTQLDKIMLSKLLPLKQFAYYSLAASVATALYLTVSPVITAVLPKLSALATRPDSSELYVTFHKTGMLVAALLFPVAWTLILFAEDIVLVWMGNADVARHSSLLVSLIAFGTMLNALVHAPHALLLAYGNSRFWFVVNLISMLLMVPAIFILTTRFGAVGAPVAWIALNLGYLFLAVPMMPIPRQERLRWYKRSILLPLVAVGTVSGAVKWMQPEYFHGLPALLWIFLSLAMGGLTSLVLFRNERSRTAIPPG